LETKVELEGLEADTPDFVQLLLLLLLCFVMMMMMMSDTDMQRE
jgi:hypothetical protein